MRDGPPSVGVSRANSLKESERMSELEAENPDALAFFRFSSLITASGFFGVRNARGVGKGGATRDGDLGSPALSGEVARDMEEIRESGRLILLRRPEILLCGSRCDAGDTGRTLY